MNVSRKIKAIRTARGLSARAVSTAAGLSQSAVRQIEAGEIASPRIETLARIAVALGVTVEDLLGGSR